MTRVSSYRLLQCSSCGQRHILSNYGSINYTIGSVPFIPKPEELMVCQRCSAQKPLNHFIPLRTIHKPEYDSTPKWFRPIRKFFDKSYKEPEPHPIYLYPDLSKTPFDPETYYPGIFKKYFDEEDAYPKWFKELAKLKTEAKEA